jgi:putative hemolysin
MSSFLLIVVLFVLFGLAAFFSLSETAIFSSNRYKLRHMASEGNRRAARLMSWLDEPEGLLATILLGSNFASVASATLAATLVSSWVRDEGLLEIALIAEAVVVTLIMLFFCELGPKAFAARYADRIALAIVIPIELCTILLSPLTRSSLKVANFFFRRVKANSTAAAEVTGGGDEVRALVAAADSQDDRMRLVGRALDFSERQVKDVVVPRIEVVAIEIDTSFEELIGIVESTRYTRFPVYRGSLDNIAGILHGKDLMPYLHSQRPFRLSQLLRKPVFIPDSAKMDSAIRMLQNAQTHLGIVVDEHGGVEGILTVEDLIEEIVGEIQDEHDVEVDAVVARADGSNVIDASISVRELNEKLSLEVPEASQYVTLAGFLLRQAGRLLKEGDEVVWNGHTFRIEQVMGRRIMRVRLSNAPQGPEAEAVAASRKTPETSS